ncbi:uncharacterized protein [Panulirus ornatus]|uniref:uncharacterized protein isoform X2 n=1 Tax=Panulirus ornatus TaxID=150431 RepID=UPI003A8A028F
MHLGNLDDSVGETSGGDSFGGYEGVEHLKRHTLSHVRAASCESLTCGCQGLPGTASAEVRPAYVNYVGRNMRRRVAALGVNARLSSLNSAYCGNKGGGDGTKDDSYIFVKKPQLTYHAVSCDVLRNDNDGEPVTADVLSKPRNVASLLAGERKTWHEDEAFVKQVVEEYFKDPAPLSDLEEKDSETITHPLPKRSMTADNIFDGKSVDLQDSSSSSSSESTSTSDDEDDEDDDEDNDVNKQADWRSPSIDDTTYCDTDETNSWFTDDSLGYEADVEPSDKDTLGQVWRRWRSAPDVRPSSDVSVGRREQQLGQHAAAAATPVGADAADTRGGGRDGAAKNGTGRVRWRGEDGGILGRAGEAAAQTPPYKHSPVCGYQTRKSCSVDETKLSRLRLGLRKVKEHKLLQFPQHDLDSKRRPSRGNGQSNRNNERVRVGGGGGGNVPSPVTTIPHKEEVDSHEFIGVVENLEFVNGKFKASADKDVCEEVLCDCVRRNVEKVGVVGEGNVGGGRGGGGSSVDGGGSVDDSTTERTHRILTQGLVVHHSDVSHDHHFVLNGSVIKNALAVLREGIEAQELEAVKSVPCEATDTPGETALPSEPGRSKEAHGENKVVQGDERVAQGVAQGGIISGESVNKGSLKEDKARDESGETKLLEKEFLDAVSDYEKQTVTGVAQDHTEYVDHSGKVPKQDNEMNRSNISIHLIPPLPRRPSHDLTLTPDSKHQVSKAKPPHNSVTKEHPPVGSWGRSPSEGRNTRTYQNIKQDEGSNICAGRRVNDGTVNPGNQRVRTVLEAGPTRRSSSVDSARRSERTSSEWRASTDTLSSSSGTSSCCHAIPRPKSKAGSKSKPLSSGHGRRRHDASHEEDLGTTSSSSTRVFDNEYHMHRVQVATGNDRKFALTTQRTVIEVPLSGGEQSETQTLRTPREESKQGGGRTPVQRSELVLGPPQLGVSQSGRHKHPPTFLTSAFPSSSSSNTCISEYNIGEAQQASPESPRLLTQGFKLSNTDVKTSKPVSDAKDENAKKSSKNSSKNKTKSKPRRYFSGILNAFGSAAPRFRGVHTPDARGEGVKKERDARKLSSEVCSQVSPDPTPRIGSDLADNRSSNRTKGSSGGGASSGKPDAASSTKTEVLQVRAATKDSSKSGLEYAIGDVAPVPSPRPRRARKNSHDSADNVVAPTPPTRRKNTEESAGKTFINGGSNEWGGQRFESPRASPRVRRGREPISHSVERNFRCNLPTTAEHPVESSYTLSGSNPPTPRPQVSYENLNFHENLSFRKPGTPAASDRSCDSREELGRVASIAKISPLSTRRTSHTHGSENHKSPQTESYGRSRSGSARVHTESSSGHSKRLHEHSRRSRKNSGGSNGERVERDGYNAEPRSSGGENGGREVVEIHGCGSGKENSGSRIDQENSPTRTSDSRRDSEEMNISRRNCGEDWLRASACLDGGTGRSTLGGSFGVDSSTGTPGRRRRPRPPSLPTTPPQSSRHRRTSHSSGTSGGSLTSSPTRWRRPQAEDTWEDSSVDGSREGRLSNSPSAESVASDSTSFYYSAVGSTVYDRPKSLCEDLTERYSFITCSQYEPLSFHQKTTATTDRRPTSSASVELQGSASTTSLPRTISGDLNCDVDVNLSEGEVKVRVRADEDVASLTSLRDDSDTESDSDEYELSGDIKTEDESRKSDSPEICHVASDWEKLSSNDCDLKDEPHASDGGVVHAVPCVTRTDSSGRSSPSSLGMPTFRGQFVDSLSSQDSRKRESSLVHASPCWATTDSDLRSSVSSTDYYGKVYLSATPKERVYEPDYENLKEQSPLAEFLEGNREASEDRASESSNPKTRKRRLSGFWTTSGEGENSDWEEETVSVDLQSSFTQAGVQEAAEEGEASQSTPVGSHVGGRTPPEYHDATDYSIVEDEFVPEEVQPLSPTPRASGDTFSTDHSAAPSDAPEPQHATPGWEQHAAAWEWHKAMWEHHQHLHQQHLHQIHQHQLQHQSFFADVMSCLGGRWGARAGSWCRQSYPDSPHTYPDDSRGAHLQDRPMPSCRWLGQYQDDPPYRPAKASSPCDMGKPPRSPLPPSGSHRSRDTSSVPREGSRPQSRQRSRSRRRAYSANSKYRVELEIPPHLLSRPRPSSFTSLAARRPGSHSPEPLEDDLRQETLQYLSGAAHDHSVDATRRRLAERKKNEGNEYYKNKEYREALKLYTQAIDLCPDCAAYYSNRSACYMMLGKYYEALNDAREAVRLDTSFVKGYLRVAKCNIALGDATAALSVLRQAGEIEPNNRAIQEEVTKAQSLIRCQDEVAKATAKADYRTAIFHLDRALELAVGCRSLKITKAEYLVFLQRYGDAQEIVNDILQYDSGNADAIYVRGMCLYYQDNPDAAFSHFQHVLRLAPDHQKARDVYKKAKLLKQKKEEGNEAFKKGNYQEAFNLYTDALAIDPLNKHTNAKLYFNRATVGSKLNKLEQATEDCTAAINLDDGYVKAYLRRAKCYQLLEKHEEAVRDYERITKLDRSQEHKRLLQEAKIQLKRSKRKDYYKILGVNKNASDDEIKKSYRKMALVHHPDRHANASEKDKHEHEIKFKEIGEAYSVLTDAKKRAMYDRGQDINDPDGGFAHEDIDPNQIFQAFFGGGHGGYSFGGHTAGFQQGGFPGSGFTGASFPGGFHFQFG